MHSPVATKVAKKKPQPGSGGTRKETRFELRSEAEWMERVERQAGRFGLTVAAYIRLATTERLERDEGTEQED